MGAKQNIYTIYASQDKKPAHNLIRRLQLLETDFNVSIWHDDPIYPGQAWKPQNASRFDADIILLLVSNAFMYSRFIQQDEFKTVIDKYKAGKATVVPILLDACPWDIEFNSDDYDFSFKELKVLPEDKKPLSDWGSADKALKHVIDRVKSLIDPIDENPDSEVPEENLKTKTAKGIKEEQTELNFTERDEVDSKVEEERLRVEAETKKRAEKEKKLKKEAETKKRAEKEKKLKKEAETKKRAEKEKKLTKEAETRKRAEKEKKLKEEAETRKRAEKEKKLKEEAETRKRAEKEKKLKKEAETKKRAEEEKKLKEEAETNKKAEEEKRLKEEVEAKKMALEEKKLREKIETKKRTEQELKRKEEALVKQRNEEEKRIREEAEAKKIALEEKRIKAESEAKRNAEPELERSEEAHAKKRVERKNRLEEEADRRNANLKATRRERLNNIINNNEESRTDETENHPLRKKVYIGLGIGILAIVGIWVFSLLGPSPEKKVSTPPKTSTTTNKDSNAASEPKVDVLPEGDPISKIAVGDTYGGGLIFAIDPSGTSGKIAYPEDAGPMPWENANAIHEELGEGWRLPTLDELRLMYRTIGQGADNSGQFADGLYWSATPYNTYQARLLRFRDGNASYHFNKVVADRKFSVRAIRDFKR